MGIYKNMPIAQLLNAKYTFIGKSIAKSFENERHRDKSFKETSYGKHVLVISVYIGTSIYLYMAASYLWARSD